MEILSHAGLSRMIWQFSAAGCTGNVRFFKSDSERRRSCEVAFAVPGFRSRYTCSLEIRELGRLVDLMKGLDETGELTWSLKEMGIQVHMRTREDGRVHGEYEFKCVCAGPSLSGDFETDGAALPDWIGQLEEVISG